MFPFLNNSDILFVILSIIIMGAGTLLKNLCFFLKKDFRYYFAKVCSMIIASTKDEDKKLAYLDILLNSYNKYLERTIKLKIKDIGKIYQSIVFLYSSETNDSILSNVQKNVECSTLSLFKFIIITFLKETPIDQFLFNVSLKELFIKRLKQTGAFFAAAIPIAISIISLYLSNKPH